MRYLPEGCRSTRQGSCGTQPVPILERQRHAHPPGDREQVNDRVGRSADRGIHANGVLERRAREDLREHHLFLHHLDDAPPGELRLAVAARIHGGNRRIAGKRDAECFDHAGHGRGGAHGHAVALRAMHAGFGGGELFLAHASAAHVLRHLPHAGARAESACRGNARTASARRKCRWSADRNSPRPSAAPAWSCRSP